jgi:hypothetical protein
VEGYGKGRSEASGLMKSLKILELLQFKKKSDWEGKVWEHTLSEGLASTGSFRGDIRLVFLAQFEQ